MNLSNELPLRIKEVEDIIFEYLPDVKGYQSTVTEAMAYSVKAGGKRLRPIMMLETYRMFGGKDKIVEPFMAAIEMIHTYSLIHDDLPAMDNDTLRRGKPTVWAKYGEGMAILAGDALLNYAFETALRSFDMTDDPELILRIRDAFRVLADKAGIYGMIGGQVADVEAEKNHIPIDQDRLMFIHELKTGALIQSSFLIGAILAGAGKVAQNAISTASLDIGIAFQIQDDILDVIGDESKIGKPVGSDEASGKETYVTIFGIDTAKQDVQQLSDEAISILLGFQNENDFLVELVRLLVNRTY